MLAKIKTWYGKYERLISSWSLIWGFIFDALTLKRVDLFWENFWVIAHLIIVGTAMVLVHAVEKEEGAEKNPSKLHFWLVNIIQFFFGGILSTYLIFYFRSGDIAVSWPFLLLLALCFWANESLKRSFVRLSFQIALYYLSIFSFAIFLIPVLLHQIGAGIFLLSGAISLVFISLFVWLIWYVSKKQFKENRWLLFGAIAGIYALINIFYFTNLLPPIPLSLKEAGVYYYLQRDSQGNYLATAEQPNWLNYFKLYPDFHEVAGSPVYVYSAVFAPSKLNITVTHEWQHLDATGKWITTDKIPLVVVGGRDGGFRTYSEKKFNLDPGHWRVNVLTSSGQVIGRIRFNLVLAEALPHIIQKINN